MATGKVEYINPPGLHTNPAFTQVITTSGSIKTIYIGMQNAVDGQGNIVGVGDLGAQTTQTLQDIDTCLHAAGARREHLVMWTIWVKEGELLEKAIAAAQSWVREMPHAPANNIAFVAGFPNPAFLIGIEAIALVPEPNN